MHIQFPLGIRDAFGPSQSFPLGLALGQGLAGARGDQLALDLYNVPRKLDR